MFDSFYSFKLIQHTSKVADGLVSKYIFQFRTKKKRYIVIAEEYKFQVLAVKFYPAFRKNDARRFNIVLNDFEFAPIIRTCINIMQYLLEKVPIASFVYIGVHSIKANKIESKAFTKRYRIYRYVMDAFLNPTNFKRYYSTSNSAVLLVNTANENLPELAVSMIEMFLDIYNELEYNHE